MQSFDQNMLVIKKNRFEVVNNAAGIFFWGGVSIWLVLQMSTTATSPTPAQSPGRAIDQRQGAGHDVTDDSDVTDVDEVPARCVPRCRNAQHTAETHQKEDGKG